jgi:hypothetical protein
MAMVGNLYIDLGGYFTSLFIMAKVGNYLENEIDLMAIIARDYRMNS